MKRSRSVLRLLPFGLFAATLAFPSLAFAGFKDGRHQSDGPGVGVGHNPGPINPGNLPPQATAIS